MYPTFWAAFWYQYGVQQLYHMKGVSAAVKREQAIPHIFRATQCWVTSRQRMSQLEEIAPTVVDEEVWREWVKEVKAINRKLNIRFESLGELLDRRHEASTRGFNGVNRDLAGDFDDRRGAGRDRERPQDFSAEPVGRRDRERHADDLQEHRDIMNAPCNHDDEDGRIVGSDVRDDAVFYCVRYDRGTRENDWLSEYDARVACRKFRSMVTPQEAQRQRMR